MTVGDEMGFVLRRIRRARAFFFFFPRLDSFRFGVLINILFMRFIGMYDRHVRMLWLRLPFLGLLAKENGECVITPRSPPCVRYEERNILYIYMYVRIEHDVTKPRTHDIRKSPFLFVFCVCFTIIYRYT